MNWKEKQNQNNKAKTDKQSSTIDKIAVRLKKKTDTNIGEAKRI